jgi:hypothetical protein
MEFAAIIGFYRAAAQKICTLVESQAAFLPTACTVQKSAIRLRVIVGITILVSRGDPPVSFVSSADTGHSS